MHNKKVAFLIPTLSIGGAETYTINLSKALSSYFDVSILVLSNDIKLNVSNNVRLYTFPIKNKIKKVFNIKKCIEDNHFDVVISVMEQANFFNLILEKICFQYTPIYSVHTPITEAFRYRSKLKRTIGYFIYNKLLSKCSNIIAVSDGIKSELTNKFSFNNVKRIYNPVDLIKIKSLSNKTIPLDKNQDFTIVTVGRLVDIKGHADLIKAFASLKMQYPKSRLIIIGHGILFEELNTLIQKEDLTESVHLLGEIPNPFPYFKISDLYICSSKLEGFGLTIVEAMATNLSIASINCDYGPREILSDKNMSYGFLSPPIIKGTSLESQQLLLNLMKDAIQSTELRRKYVINSEKKVRDFSIDLIKEEYFEYIKSTFKTDL
jgi:glycosyltransferase involved in cell wall biosynthesis